MKVTVFGELLLLAAVLALAYLLYVQQEQMAELALDVDRVRGAIGELAERNGAAAELSKPAPKRPAPKRKPAGASE